MYEENKRRVAPLNETADVRGPCVSGLGSPRRARAVAAAFRPARGGCRGSGETASSIAVLWVFSFLSNGPLVTLLTHVREHGQLVQDCRAFVKHAAWGPHTYTLWKAGRRRRKQEEDGSEA